MGNQLFRLKSIFNQAVNVFISAGWVFYFYFLFIFICFVLGFFSSSFFGLGVFVVSGLSEASLKQTFDKLHFLSLPHILGLEVAARGKQTSFLPLQ